MLLCCVTLEMKNVLDRKMGAKNIPRVRIGTKMVRQKYVRNLIL